MATLVQLCDDKKLIQLGGGLEDHELPERQLYAFPDVVEWLDETLPDLDPFFHEGAQDPLEQADELLHDFVSGEDFAFYEKSHSMTPADAGVWELKTPDIRFFGWFVKKRVFVIAQISSAQKCKEHNLYAGFRNMTVHKRDQLPLDEPKYVLGDYHDVL